MNNIQELTDAVQCLVYALKCGYESISSSWILLRVVYTLLGCFYNILGVVGI